MPLLTDLEPGIYYYKNLSAGIYFWCPHCFRSNRKVRLTCKWVVISIRDQMDIFLDTWGPGHVNIVPCNVEMCWDFKGTGFSDLSVTPSLDASKAGHWHGSITNGNCQ